MDTEGEEKVPVAKKDSKEEGSTFRKLRSSKKFRLWVIVILMAIVAVMFVFLEKMRIALVVIFIALLAALGLEVSENDWDLGTLWETKSFEESRVVRDSVGNILFDKAGNITTDSSIGKSADDYNCADFDTQPEAQRFFDRVGGAENDVNRLDGDKDGEACESLPKGSN